MPAQPRSRMGAFLMWVASAALAIGSLVPAGNAEPKRANGAKHGLERQERWTVIEG